MDLNSFWTPSGSGWWVMLMLSPSAASRKVSYPLSFHIIVHELVKWNTLCLDSDWRQLNVDSENKLMRRSVAPPVLFYFCSIQLLNITALYNCSVQLLGTTALYYCSLLQYYCTTAQVVVIASQIAFGLKSEYFRQPDKIMGNCISSYQYNNIQLVNISDKQTQGWGWAGQHLQQHPSALAVRSLSTLQRLSWPQTGWIWCWCWCWS